MLNYEDPSFVFMTGDMTSGSYAHRNPGFFEKVNKRWTDNLLKATNKKND